MSSLIRKTLLAAAGLSAVTLSLSAIRPAHADTEAPKTSAGKWGDFGIQTQWMDAKIKPGNDFDDYVNGVWKQQTDIPADKTSVGGFMDLYDLSQDRLHAIIDGLIASKPAPGSDAARIVATYQAFMDTDAIDKAGLAPAQPYLDRIFAAKTPEDLAKLFDTAGYASPVTLSPSVDQKNSDVYALYLTQSGLGLPDRSYYLKQDEKSRDIRAKYVDYLGFLLGKIGYKDPASAAKAVMSLETRMAQAEWDPEISRNDDLTYNRLSLSEFDGLANQDLMRALLANSGAPASTDYVVAVEMPPTKEELAKAGIDAAQSSAEIGGGLPETLNLVETVPVSTWQAYMASRFLSENAAVLPHDIDEAHFDFYNKLLRGQEKERPRWKRGIGTVESQIGELLGKLYAEKYYPPAEKEAMTRLVANLRKAMAVDLQDLPWMSAATRQQALVKLDAFIPKIGAPETFKTYDGLEPSAADPIGNAMAAARWQNDYDMNRLGKPVDRKEWFMLPETVNAYYNPTFNEIVFPAAILQPPFFNLSADPAVNYGAIGAVIGHEMSHGFDDQGAKSDAKGNLRDWWTPADTANFKKMQDALAAQYDTFCPFDDGKTCVNGRLTMGENIADLSGLAIAYRAYQISLNGKPAPVIDGYTGDQRFFMAFAQVFRSKIREQLARQYLVIDPHSPDHFRINGAVRNFTPWYKAFNVKPDDKLYLPPDKRVRIW